MIGHIEMVNVIKLNATNINYVYYHNKNKINIDSYIMDPNKLELAAPARNNQFVVKYILVRRLYLNDIWLITLTKNRCNVCHLRIRLVSIIFRLYYNL